MCNRCGQPTHNGYARTKSAPNTRFWLVWSPDAGSNPRVRHATRREALDETIRLAKQNPGMEFYVACVTSRASVLLDVQVVALVEPRGY